MKKRICCLFLLELVVVLLLSITWEFWLEDLTYSVTIFEQEPEDTGQRLEYVMTSFVFVLIALALPFHLIMKNVVSLEQTRDDLEKSLNEIKTMKGLLAMCANCKKIRADDGSWQRLEDYMWEHAETKVSHGICPDCTQQCHPDFLPRD